MKALVYDGPGQRDWREVPEPTDAVVRVDAVTICGTDLHILKGDVPEVTPGRVLGHEAVGTVQNVGAAVKPGDRVRRHLHLRPARRGQCLDYYTGRLG